MSCGGCCASVSTTVTDRPAGYWARLGVALVLAGQGMVFGLAINLESPAYGSQTYWWLHGALLLSALVVMGLLGPRLVRESLLSLRARKLTVEALFVASCLGAFVGSLISTFTGQGAVYYEVVAIVLAVYSVGKRIGDVSRDRVLAEIQNYRADYESALKMFSDDHFVPCSVKELTAGDRIKVLPGRPVTVDGVILKGEGSLRESHLTGEPVPVVRVPGNEVYAGSWSIHTTFEIEVRHGYGERKIDALLDWVETARRHPSGLQEEADRAISWFFPMVVVVALGTFFGWYFSGVGWAPALFNCMAVLLLACPCALGLATPIAVWKGMFRLASLGLVCRHGQAFDALGRSQRVFFDKTGTLSEPRLIVSEFQTVDSNPLSTGKVARWVAALEKDSEHPVAKALATLGDPDMVKVIKTQSFLGKGIEGTIEDGNDRANLKIGTPSFFSSDSGKDFEKIVGQMKVDHSLERQIWIAVDDRPTAVATVNELLRASSVESLQKLRERGLAVEILSGDPNPGWETIGGVQIDKGLSPEEKKDRVAESSARGEWPLFVGDGINDTPAMVTGGASIAVSDGASIVKEVADAVLVQSDLGRIATGIDVSRSVRSSVAGNIRFALVYNLIGISLAAAGILHPLVAALLMVCSSALVSVRALNSAEFDEGAPTSVPKP